MLREDREGPRGEVDWKAAVIQEEGHLYTDRPVSPLDKWFIPRFSSTPEGSRLTPERIQGL